MRQDTQEQARKLLVNYLNDAFLGIGVLRGCSSIVELDKTDLVDSGMVALDALSDFIVRYSQNPYSEALEGWYESYRIDQPSAD